MHDPWTKCGSSDDHWVRGVLEPILLLLVIAIIAVLVGFASGWDSVWRAASFEGVRPVLGDCEAMMQNMMDGGMWGMGVGGVVLLILVVLVMAALVKYLFFRWQVLP
jgi:hypothetical protein